MRGFPFRLTRRHDDTGGRLDLSFRRFRPRQINASSSRAAIASALPGSSPTSCPRISGAAGEDVKLSARKPTFPQPAHRLRFDAVAAYQAHARTVRIGRCCIRRGRRGGKHRQRVQIGQRRVFVRLQPVPRVALRGQSEPINVNGQQPAFERQQNRRDVAGIRGAGLIVVAPQPAFTAAQRGPVGPTRAFGAGPNVCNTLKQRPLGRIASMPAAGQLETFSSDAKTRKQSPTGGHEASTGGVVWLDFLSSTR